VRRLLKRPAATLVRSALLASVLVVLVAAPASAQTIDHHQNHLWHYWIAPVLLISGVLMVVALSFGYYWKVMRGR
jgi:hypothetical protein